MTKTLATRDFDGTRRDLQSLGELPAVTCSSGQPASGRLGSEGRTAGRVWRRYGFPAQNACGGLAAFYGSFPSCPTVDNWLGLQPHLLPYDGIANEILESCFLSINVSPLPRQPWSPGHSSGPPFDLALLHLLGIGPHLKISRSSIFLAAPVSYLSSKLSTPKLSSTSGTAAFI